MRFVPCSAPAIALLAPLAFAACAPLAFNYQPSPGDPAPNRNVSVTVGDVTSSNPFPEPNRIRWDATLDRPVTQAVREALVVELKQAGFTLGGGGPRVTAFVQHLVLDANDSSIVFAIESPLDGRTLYKRRIPARLAMYSIWDFDGFAASLRTCLQQFTSDPAAIAALTGTSPSVGEPARAAAPPAAGAPNAAGAKPWWQQ
jgi:hypothetical protein